MLTRDQIIEKLQTVKDPEIALDIWTMGLIYKLDVADQKIDILMTYTTPFCPWGPQINEEIKKVLEGNGQEVTIELTFDPPYKIPDEVRVMMGV
jgi:metal-sulfur cluster biosynthetic enzyme